jgi:hypothetical protein
VHTDAQAGQEQWPLTAPWSDQRWTPTATLVKGSLAKGSIEEVTKAQAWTARLGVYAGTDLIVAKDGPVRLRLKAGPEAELWVDGQKLGGSGESTAQLKAGSHRVLVKMDPKKVPAEVRLESPDASFSLN